MERHVAVDTDTLMGIANDMAGFAETPPDSAIYYAGQGIRKVLVGIDIGAADLLIAREYGFDAVIAHHPLGLVNAWRCFGAHEEQLVRAGVPRAEAHAAVAPTMQALALRSQAENFDQLSSMARLLDMPLLNIHQPLDEVGRRLLQEAIDVYLSANPAGTLRGLAEALQTLQAFQRAPTRVLIALGTPDAAAGRVVMAHGAFTDGGHAITAAYFRHDIDTVVSLHLDPAERDRLQEDGTGQVLVTGRIAGDAVGLNPYIARLEALGLEVVRINGALG